MIDVTEADFEEKVLKSKLPVLVDFWGGYCPPCKALHPILEQLSKEYEGKLVFARVDIETNPRLTAEHGIISIPALLLFRGGEVVDTSIGFRPKEQLREWLDSCRVVEFLS